MKAKTVFTVSHASAILILGISPVGWATAPSLPNIRVKVSGATQREAPDMASI